MSDIFREVDEALQKEKAAAFWKDYGPTLVIAAIILVLSTAITTAYRHWDHSQNREETAKLVAAANDPDMVAAMEKTAGDTRDPHKAVALLSAANKAGADKDFAKALMLYTTVADDNSAPDDLRDLATVLSARTNLLTTDAPDYKILIDKLLPVAKNKKSAFANLAKLEAASLYGNQKDYNAALDLLQNFEEESTSDSLKEKATALKHVYEYEASQKPAQE